MDSPMLDQLSMRQVRNASVTGRSAVGALLNSYDPVQRWEQKDGLQKMLDENWLSIIVAFKI